MRSSAATAAPSAAPLHRWWTVALVAGELVGFVPPALTGAALAAVGVADVVLVAGLVLAGLLEGATIGVAQSLVLARYAPAVDRRDWVVATAAAACFAWFVGMAGGAVISAGIAPAGLVAALLVPAWAAALLAMGYAQWRVLRRTVAGSGRWVWVTSGAWALGVMVPVVALSLTPNGWPPWAHVVVGVLAAAAMGAVVGALTGPTLQRLVAGEGAGDPGMGESRRHCSTSSR
jgi:hypothetical protein